MGNCVGQFEAPEELDRARLKYLQRWTEKRLDTVAASEPGKDIDVYRLLCETIRFFILYQHICFPLTIKLND